MVYSILHHEEGLSQYFRYSKNKSLLLQVLILNKNMIFAGGKD